MHEGRLLLCRHKYGAGAVASSIIMALDPATGRVLSGPEELNDDPLVRSGSHATTKAGNRVVAGARAITVLKGNGPDVERVIPTDTYFRRLTVRGDVIVYGPEYAGYTGMSGPAVIAVDANSGKTLWALHDVEKLLGISSVTDRIYVSEPGGLRALEPESGRLLWRQPLPRLQGSSSAREHGDKTYVVIANPCGMECSWNYIHCLDAVTGAPRWTFDPQISGGFTPLVVHEGRVFTFIAPTRVGAAFLGYDCRSHRSQATEAVEPAIRACLRKRFAEKTPEEIELNLRAWHALGDHSLIPMMQHALEVLKGTALDELPATLIATYPPVHNPIGLIGFLEAQFAEAPDLGPEIRRILQQYDPIPYWAKEEKNRNRSKLCDLLPRFEPDPQEQALFDAFMSLKTRVEAVPTTRLTPSTITELMLRQGTATFESLVKAHDASTDSDQRLLIRMALYTQHPRQASDWALGLLDQISAMEITQWVQRAPVEWLLEHHELFEKWLHHEDASVRGFSARALNMSDNSEAVVPFCVKLLERGLEQQITDRDVEALQGAMRTLAKTDDPAHAALLRRYVKGVTVSVTLPGDKQPSAETLEAQLYMAADSGLRKLGIVDIPPLRGAGSTPSSPPTGSQEDVCAFQLMQTMEDLSYRGKIAEAQALARQVIDTLLQQEPGRCYSPDSDLAKAYETLEQWDEAIHHTFEANKDNPEDAEYMLGRLYRKAGRLDKLEALADLTRRDDIAIDAAIALLHKERLDKAQQTFSRVLKENPNGPTACVGLALIYFKRGELDRADAMMDRAVALRPRPEAESLFENTFTYWINRGKPDKARTWLRESWRIDRFWWERDGWSEWAEQFDELKDTVAELRSQSNGPGSSP